MIKKYQLPRYSYQFLSHVRKFIVGVDSNFLRKSPVIGLSGGVDSVVLAYFSVHLWKQGLAPKPRFIHIDHGTREEIAQEVSHLRKWALELGVDFESHSIKLSLTMANFENIARQERLKIFGAHVLKSEILLLGHHLDDSFEWSLMQKFKSSRPESSLGIPVRFGNILRPLLCVSKKQVVEFAKELGLHWFEDKSNEILDYERNNIRHFIAECVAPRYPRYLKHYVNQSNALALKFGVSVYPEVLESYIVHNRDWGLLVLIEQELGSEILPIILSLSEKKRGKVSKQLEQLLLGFKNGRVGPYSFSGGINIYCFGSSLLIVKKGCTPVLNDNGAQIPEMQPFLVQAKKRCIKKARGPFKKEMNLLINQPVHFDYSWRIANGKVLYWI